MVIAVDHDRPAATALKAEALDEIAYNMTNATGRNYLHTCAQQLRESLGLNDERPDAKAVEAAS